MFKRFTKPIHLKNQTLSWENEELTFDWIQSKRKSFGISIHPNQKVIVRSPFRVRTNELRSFIFQKWPWIQKHRERLSQLPLRTEKKYTLDEEHYFLGTPYRITWKYSSKKTLTCKEGYIHISSPRMYSSSLLKASLKAWYKSEGELYFSQRLEKQAQRFSHLPFKKCRLKQRYMKSRWGSCSTKGDITLNTRLMMYPENLIDYVITHELSHLYEANHSSRFYAIMDDVMPDWKKRKDELATFSV